MLLAINIFDLYNTMALKPRDKIMLLVSADITVSDHEV